MRIKIEDTLFCLVDVQEKLFPHIGNKDELLRTLPILVKGIKTLDVPIIIMCCLWNIHLQLKMYMLHSEEINKRL